MTGICQRGFRIMIVTFLNVALPLFLGYSLFVGISGRLNPVSCPYSKQDQSTWALGLWTGVAVYLISFDSARALYTAPVDSPAIDLLIPAAILLAYLIIPALGLFALFRYRITQLERQKSSDKFDWTLRGNNPEQGSAIQIPAVNSHSIDDSSPKSRKQAVQSLDVIPTYLETIKTGQMVDYPPKEAVNDPDDTGSKHRVVNSNGARHFVSTSGAVQHMSVEGTRNRSDVQISEMLQIETALREETEKHLRITRKALAVLEATTRSMPVKQSQTQTVLEERLADSQATTDALKANVMQEKARRLESERQAIELKQKVINAKREIRRGAAARAKALSTANKSIAFARQSVQIRTRLESELEKAHHAINIRQKTISSLVNSLDKEKRRTREEIGSAAKQLVLQDRHHKARRSLEEVARSVENNLASRLVKKVAKARPLMPDTDQSNLG